jgi:hypothetical protein
MSDREREQLELVYHLFPKIDSLLGPECAGILRSGRKVELEGAFRGAAQKSGFATDLRRYLCEAEPAGTLG